MLHLVFELAKIRLFYNSSNAFLKLNFFTINYVQNKLLDYLFAKKFNFSNFFFFFFFFPEISRKLHKMDHTERNIPFEKRTIVVLIIFMLLWSVKSSVPEIRWNTEKCLNIFQDKELAQGTEKKISSFTKAIHCVSFLQVRSLLALSSQIYSCFFPIFYWYDNLFFYYFSFILSCLLIIGWNNNKPSRINISNSHAKRIVA